VPATSIIVQNSSSVQEGPQKSIVIPVRYFGYVRIVLTVWLAVWGLIELFLVVSLVRISTDSQPAASSSIAGLGLLLASFTGAGGFMIWRFLWVNKGREILDCTSQRLRVRRKPSIGRPEEFDRAKIRNLHIGSYAGRLIYPSWGRAFLGKEEYFIGFDYDGKPHEITRGVRRKDAERVVAMLLESRG